jgi:type VI secretion system protein ImpL
MDLAAIWPWALGGVIVLALTIVIFLVALLRKAAKVTKIGAPPEPEEGRAEGPSHVTTLADDEVGVAAAFRRASKLLDRTTGGSRHDVPLFLLAGAEASRDPDLLGTIGLDLPFGTAGEAEMGLGHGRGFWFYDRGIILDVAGDLILGADGRTSDDKGWSALLKHIQELRPKRPVDGVILTIPCGELLEAAANDLRRTDLATRMGRIFRKLWDAQQRLGFRLPTYVVVTNCERLTGFRALCASLPESARGEMLGWSSPYSIESVYRSSWIDEAFSMLARRLEDVQLEIFAEGTDEGEWLLRLPQKLASLATPLRACLDNVFKSSAYHGSLILRGIWFCGRGEIGSAVDAQPTGRTSFVSDLLEKKVFTERGLATPTSRTIVARNRAVHILQAAVVAAILLLGGGLWLANAKFRHQNAVLIPFLQRSVSHLRILREQRAMGQRMAHADLAQASAEVLDRMALLDFHRYGSIFVPVSWFNPFEGHLQRAISISFRELILKAIRVDLEGRADSLIDAATQQIVPAASVVPATLPVITPVSANAGRTLSPSPLGGLESPPYVSGSVNPAPIVAIEGMPEFAALKRFVDNARQIEENGRVFNSLSTTADLHDLGKLVQFTFNRNLPDAFYNDAGLYEAALQQTQYGRFDATRYTPPASSAVATLAENFYAALYRRNPFQARLDQLTPLLQRASWKGSPEGEKETFAELSRRLRDIDGALAGPELAWAFRPNFDLGPAYNGVVNDVSRSKFFGPDVARAMRDAGNAGWNEFRGTLATSGSPLTGPILSVRSGRPEMSLSADTLVLKYALDTFLGQPFVTGTQHGGRLRADLPKGTRLAWNGIYVDRAAAVAAAYDRFRDKSLDLFPADLRVSIDQVAREHARGEMLDLLADAQSFESIQPPVGTAMREDAIRADLAAFNAEVPPLSNIVGSFSHLGAGDAQRDVMISMTNEAFRILRQVDKLLDDEQPYRPRQGSFSWWDGTTPPTPAAWSARDAAETSAYLDATRARVATLAGYARPLLQWMNKSGTAEQSDIRWLSGKWQGIVDDLGDYDAKKPGNAVASLEDYVSNRMAKVSVADCTASALGPGHNAHGYFATRLQDLSRELSSRCYTLAGTDAVKRYTDLARYFNNRLAGRYPFADAAPMAGQPEADPADVRAFFRMFDTHRPVIVADPSAGGLDPSLASARHFIDEMTAVRAFFAPFLEAPKPDAPPAIDVEATFRVLRQREIDADQIIRWSFGVGPDVVTNRDAKPKLRWVFGKPVTLTLRWAADAPRVPIVISAGRGVSVDDRTIRYEYTNKWALLTALADHVAPPDDLPDYADVEPVTLAFNVYTQAARGGQKSDIPTQAFLRLALLAPGTTKTLDVPHFPSRAPRLEKKAVTAEGGQ